MFVSNDRYDFIKFLGSGRYSEVYEVKDLDKKKNIALKVFCKKNDEKKKINSFYTEVNILSSISHCNVVSLIDYDENICFQRVGGSVVTERILSLELCEFGDLFDFLKNKSTFDRRLNLNFICQLIDGVHALHKAGICHRDLKLDNILINNRFVLKIADFGYGCFFDVNDKSPKFKTACGTPQYVAPEILSNYGKKYDGKKADVWSMAVVCFMLVYGHPPFNCAHMSDIYGLMILFFVNSCFGILISVEFLMS